MWRTNPLRYRVRPPLSELLHTQDTLTSVCSSMQCYVQFFGHECHNRWHPIMLGQVFVFVTCLTLKWSKNVANNRKKREVEY